MLIVRVLMVKEVRNGTRKKGYNVHLFYCESVFICTKEIANKVEKQTKISAIGSSSARQANDCGGMDSYWMQKKGR